ncbi:MAG: hypothetical protein WEB57_10220 [Pseudohongiellaceae bacterium]
MNPSVEGSAPAVHGGRRSCGVVPRPENSLYVIAATVTGEHPGALDTESLGGGRPDQKRRAPWMAHAEPYRDVSTGVF